MAAGRAKPDPVLQRRPHGCAGAHPAGAEPRKPECQRRRHGMDFRHNRLDVTYYEGTSLVTLRQPDAAQPVLDAALAAQDPEHLKARSIVQLAVATTYTQQREIDQACAIASQALDLPADQRIGPITQRAQDLLLVLEPWRGRPAVEDLRERVVAS